MSTAGRDQRLKRRFLGSLSWGFVIGFHACRDWSCESGSVIFWGELLVCWSGGDWVRSVFFFFFFFFFFFRLTHTCARLVCSSPAADRHDTPAPVAHRSGDDSSASSGDGEDFSSRCADASALLALRYPGRFIVWDASSHDDALAGVPEGPLFARQVLRFRRFRAGLSSALAGLPYIVRLCQTVESWLGDEPGHVAVILAETRARAVFLAACYCAYVGVAEGAPAAIELAEARVPYTGRGKS
jgi:hypothetical protein